MNWWIILEIPHDSDLKTIKKAYAKFLKSHNPEDDAEGYQRLREAYDIAVKYAKNKDKTQEVTDIIEDKSENEDDKNKSDLNLKDYYIEVQDNRNIIMNNELNFSMNEIYPENNDTRNNSYEQIEEFFYRLNEIYKDITLRIDSKVWEDILNSDVIWNVDSYPIIEERMFDFLIKHKYLPAEIWTKLNNNFTWSKNERKLYDRYSEDIVDEFIKNLKEPSKLKYDFIKSINSEIAEEYLFEREQVYEALKAKKYAKAFNHIKKAKSLFNEDSELLRLMGNYHYEFKDIEKALELYKSALEINNKDFNSAYNIGKHLVITENFSEAIPYLKMYLEFDDNDVWALNYIAYAYYYNEEFILAKENFQKLLSFEVKDKVIKRYLKNIEVQLKKKHVRKIKLNKENLVLEEIVKREIKKVNWYYTKYIVYEIIPIFIKVVASIIVLSIVSSGMRYHSEHKGMENSNYSRTYEDKSYMSQETFFYSHNNVKITMCVNNIKSIKYYKLTKPFNNKVIFSEKELDENGLRDKVESQLKLGVSGKNIIIFSDSKCNDNTISENGEYKLDGLITLFDKEIGEKIRNEYDSDYNELTWVRIGFVDASKAATKKTIKKK